MTELLTFHRGDPEPDETVQRVKAAVVVWERRPDGLWHSTWPRSTTSYTWEVLCAGFPELTEVRESGQAPQPV